MLMEWKGCEVAETPLVMRGISDSTLFMVLVYMLMVLVEKEMAKEIRD